MKKKFLAIALTLTLVFSLVACSSDGGNDDAGEDTGAGEETEYKVGMVTDEGGVNDQSFNQSAHEGLLKAEEELGIEQGYQESHEEADYVPNFETLLDGDYDLMWGVGFKLANAVWEAAEANPDKLYAIIDHTFDGDEENYPGGTPENVVGVMFKQEQPSFLVGYIAGMMTETDKVGFVGGIESDLILAFDYGYQSGVKYAANELDKEIDVLSQYAESFSDAGKGSAIATSMYQDGRDIIFHAAGGVGEGVIGAAEEQGKWAIGVDRDQNDISPDHVLTSAMKRVDVGVFNVTEALVKGEFPGGTTITYGLEDGGAVDIAPSSDKHVPQDILDRVEELKQQIIDGEFEVPYDEASYKAFIDSLE